MHSVYLSVTGHETKYHIRLLWQVRDPVPKRAGHASLFLLNKGIR